MTAELRRGLFLAILGLLLGLGLVAALFGGGGYLKRAAMAPAPSTDSASSPVGAVSPGAGGAGGAPDVRSSGKGEPGRQANLAPPGAVRPDAAATDANALRFDIVRVEPNGDSVVAGRGAPNTVVELLVDGRAVARALADPSGQFAIVPPALPAGNSEIVLRSTDAEGRETRSKDSVAVAVSTLRDTKPLVALTSPDRPTVVLSQPDAPQAKPGSPAVPGKDAVAQDAAGNRAPGRNAPGNTASGKVASAKTGPAKTVPTKTVPGRDAPGKPATDGGAPVTIVSVDAQEGGRLFVTSRAPPGATVRLYLNDTLIAPASVGADGNVTFTIGRGVKPGAYKVRIDQVDSVSGKVRGRAEVPFSVPEPARVAAGDKPAAKPIEQPGARTPSVAAAPAAQGQAPVAVAPLDAKGAAAAPQPNPGTSTPAAFEPPKPAGPPAPGGVFVAEIGTAKIIRGDSLWQISRRTYGTGDRYTVIYDANQEQIRNPDLIYPGQIFVLPGEGRGGKRG